MTCSAHGPHPHVHSESCDHPAVRHGGHVDYLHDGHLHHHHDDHVDEHALSVNTVNPTDCTAQHTCNGHEKMHRHGDDCGHARVPHDNHIDYWVDDHLHHIDRDHCDDHGPLKPA